MEEEKLSKQDSQTTNHKVKINRLCYVQFLRGVLQS